MSAPYGAPGGAEITSPLGADPIERKPQRHGGYRPPRKSNRVLGQLVVLKSKLLLPRLIRRALPPTLLFLGLVLSGTWIVMLAYAFFAAIDLV